ncbi:reverse transcriptase domain-containing protein [Tanacetum coccineum]
MLNSSTGLFFFQFSSIDGLDSMLENEDVDNVPVWVKLHGVPVTTFSEYCLSAIAIKLGTPLMLESYTSDMCMQSWSRSSYARAMIELRADVELKDTIVNNANSSGNKKKDVESKKDVSNPNPFDVLNSVENDINLGPNRGTSNSTSKRANYGRSSFFNVGSSTTSTTLIVERLIIHGKFTLVDDEGKPLKKGVGYGTNNLLEQWREIYRDIASDYGPYDDDMYEDQEFPNNI